MGDSKPRPRPPGAKETGETRAAASTEPGRESRAEPDPPRSSDPTQEQGPQSKFHGNTKKQGGQSKFHG